MQVGQTARASGGQASKRAKSKGNTGKTFRVDAGDGAPTAPSVGGVGAIAPLSALLAVQEADQVQNERERAVAQGRELLDFLDELKIGLLTGHIAPTKIRHLEQAVDRLVTLDNDEGLQDLLDQIALRAKVELAKLRR